MINPFFENKGPIKINDILKSINIINNSNYQDVKIFDIKDIYSATDKDITFFHSKKYDSVAA